MKKINELAGYEDFEGYKIDNQGNVWSYIKRGTNRKYGVIDWDMNPVKMSTSIKSNGYVHLGLSSPKGYKYPTIHRLLALAFIPNINNEPQVNHINGIKSDNTLENLEWVNRSRNVRHAFDIGLNYRFSNGTNRTVDKLSLDGKYIESYPSITDAVIGIGLKTSSKSAITRVCQGKQKTCGGFRWRYAN